MQIPILEYDYSDNYYHSRSEINLLYSYHEAHFRNHCAVYWYIKTV